MKNKLHIIIALAVLSVPVLLGAADFIPSSTLEETVAYDYLTPADLYDDWVSGEFRYTSHFDPANTVLLAAGASFRDENFGWLQAGLYHDWFPRFYTFTSVTTSSSDYWMGRWRFDNDFNFKLGSQKQFILALGQTAILYPNDKEDYILSAGLVWYREHLIIDYRHFFNRSDPGEVWSDTDRLSVGFGTMGKNWTTITGAYGNQAYMAMGNQLSVDQDVISINLMEQIWLKRNCGIKFGVGYQKVEDGYEKYNASFGLFQQFP